MGVDFTTDYGGIALIRCKNVALCQCTYTQDCKAMLFKLTNNGAGKIERTALKTTKKAKTRLMQNMVTLWYTCAKKLRKSI